MSFLTILTELETIRKLSQVTPDSNKIKLNPQAKKQLEEKEAENNACAKTKLENLLNNIPQELGTNAGPLLQRVVALYTQPHLTENPTCYEKILPLCELAYCYEQNGDPKEHATKLATIFNNKQAVITYWLRSGEKSNNPNLVHDTCLFELPDPNECTFTYWKTLANQADNMLNPEFRKLLPHANAIESLIATKNKPEITAETIVEVETRLKEAARQYKITKRAPAAHLSEDERNQRTASLKALAQQRQDASIELAKRCVGMPLKKMTVLKLQALYAQYKTNHNPNHTLLVEHGISQKEIRVFDALKRSNDDKAIPAIVINGNDIGYPGIYLKKLDTISDQGAAIAACLGRMTDCCQYLGGAGSDCAIHGITSPNGGFYVLCKGDANEPQITDEILAQSWVWRSKRGALCLDSIEKTAKTSLEMASDMYRYLGHMLCRQHNIPHINTGTNSGITNDVGLTSYVPPSEEPLDYNGYRDSNKQWILANSNMPYLLVGEAVSDTFNRMINKQSSEFFNAIFQRQTPIKNNESLRQAIAFALHDNQRTELLQLIALIAGKRGEELNALIDTNKKYIEQLNQNIIDFSAIEQGAFKNAINSKGQSALHIAAINNDKATVQRLITSGANLAIQDKEGKTTLHLLANNPDLIIETLRLIPKKQRLEMVNTANSLRQTVLHLPTVVMKPDSLMAILKLIPENQRLEAVNTKDKRGQAALYLTAAYNLNSLIAILKLIPENQRLEALKASGADLNTTVLHLIGASSLQGEILTLIPENQQLEMAKETRPHDCSEGSILKNFVVGNSHEFLTKVLRLMPEDQRLAELIKKVNLQGNTVMHFMYNTTPLNDGTDALVEMLKLIPKAQRLEAVKAADNDGNTPLHCAIRNPDALIAILKLIPVNQQLEAITVPDKHGKTVLTLANSRGIRVLELTNEATKNIAINNNSHDEFLRLLELLKTTLTTRLNNHPDAQAEANTIIKKLTDAANSFYGDSEGAGDIKAFQGIYKEALNLPDASVIREHRKIFGAFFAAINHFFKALAAKTGLTNNTFPKPIGFFDSRTGSTKTIENFSQALDSLVDKHNKGPQG